MDATRENDGLAWLQGPSAKCSEPPEHPVLAWRLVLLGAPGCGKGTQAALLTTRMGACHLSTGDVFRAARDQTASPQSPALAAALEFMRRGDLVPDATVWAMVRERAGCLCCPAALCWMDFRAPWDRRDRCRLCWRATTIRCMR